MKNLSESIGFTREDIREKICTAYMDFFKSDEIDEWSKISVFDHIASNFSDSDWEKLEASCKSVFSSVWYEWNGNHNIVASLGYVHVVDIDQPFADHQMQNIFYLPEDGLTETYKNNGWKQCFLAGRYFGVVNMNYEDYTDAGYYLGHMHKSVLTIVPPSNSSLSGLI